MGEHFVVHGVPAIALPVEKIFSTVEISSRHSDAQPRFSAIYPGANPKFVDHELLSKMSLAFAAACHVLGIELISEVAVSSYSNFELSRGFGSSASFAVALVRALLAQNPSTGFEEIVISDAILEVEKIFHGNPSGIDTATIYLESPLYFKRGAAPEKFVNRGADFLLLDGGPRDRCLELVKSVQNFQSQNFDRWASLASETATLVDQAYGCFSSGAEAATDLGKIANQGHEILSSLGLSTEYVDFTIKKSSAFGARGGKVSGAGAGGAVLIVTDKGQGAVLAEKLLEEKIAVVGVVRGDA